MAAATQTFPQSTVTKDELKAFHNIDQILFIRLVFKLRRDPAESMQVIAFLLWLEQTRNARDLVFVTKNWHDSLVNHLANEAVQCLQCLEFDEFNIASEAYPTPLIQGLTKGGVSLRFVFENRVRIISGIAKIVTDVCLRAFEDIMEQLKQSQENAEAENRGTQSGNRNPLPPPVGIYNYYIPSMVPGVVNYVPTVIGNYYQVPGSANVVYDVKTQKQIFDGQIEGGGLRRLQISSSPSGSSSVKEAEKGEIVVPEDDRTIFLTFSKGYPISETEVINFFKMKFGDCIESVLMQEVAAGEQPLFARMVVQTTPSLEKILGGNRKAKFSINGKHLWARKYVPKSQKTPPQSPPAPATPPAS